MKKILVINSNSRPLPDFYDSEAGNFRLYFAELHNSDDIYRLHGQIFDDAVWIRRLRWDDPDREEIEFAVRSRLVNRNA